ncbi:SLATT domain-containing protein [Streptomyces sp. 11x1]|uniref:SLATT domain-containing protein n=1 Tax=Streptomyces sp. 11x1 TaxID=3038642 RepID=UPI00292CEFB4|nr:SLATT domain-containing protein [Streptomyces sp. 11x1]WNZ09647.1 SLATT domain-containing protein [Streptomyces sp. 11x1]
MSTSETLFESIKTELARIQSNCLYTAQGYFEAAKSAEKWGRLMVFIPACVTAISSLLVAVKVGPEVFFSGLGAVSGAVAATAAFLGSPKTAADHLASARAYTALKHRADTEISLMTEASDLPALEVRVRELSADYVRITSTDTPMANKFYEKAQQRIQRGAAE